MEFEKLKLQKQGNWITRFFANPQNKKTVVYTFAGAIVGIIAFFVTEAREMDVIQLKDVLGSTLTGAAIGFLITNSPCARGRC